MLQQWYVEWKSGSVWAIPLTGDLFCNLYKGISPRKLFAFFPLCCLTLNRTKLCLYSNLQSSPHILCLFSVLWEAPPSLPANNQVNPQLDFPSFSFAHSAVLSFSLAASLVSGDRLHVVAFLLAVAAQDFLCQAASSACCEAQHDCGDSPLPV